MRELLDEHAMPHVVVVQLVHALAVVASSTIVLRLHLLIGRHQDPKGLANVVALIGKPNLMFNASSKPKGSNAHVFIGQPISGYLFFSCFSFLLFHFMFLFPILFSLFLLIVFILFFFTSIWKTLFPHYMNIYYSRVYEQCFSIIEHSTKKCRTSKKSCIYFSKKSNKKFLTFSFSAKLPMEGRKRA